MEKAGLIVRGLNNAEKNITHYLHLKEADAKRLDTDKQFAMALFQQAEAILQNAQNIKANEEIPSTRNTTSATSASIKHQSVQSKQQMEGNEESLSARRDDAHCSKEISERVEVKQVNNNNHTLSHVSVSETCQLSDVSRRKAIHNWQYGETKLLIACYGSHADELGHPFKRLYFWDNVVNDLLSNKCNVSKEMCINKWSNLLRSYKTAKDKNGSTGQGISRFHFYDQMDEILGKMPSNSSPHTIGSLTKNKDKVESKANNEIGDEPKNVDIEKITTLTPKKTTCTKTLKRKISSKVDESQQHRDKKMALEWAKLENEKKKMELEERKIQVLERYLKERDNDKFT